MEYPTQIEEIERKSLEEIERLECQLRTGLIDERQYYTALQTLYNCVSGCLTSEVMTELEKHLAESPDYLKLPRALRVKVSHGLEKVIVCKRDSEGFAVYSCKFDKIITPKDPEKFVDTVRTLFDSMIGVEL